MSRENVRVRRTRTLLRQALVELIEEHGFERLTVGQITERAMVSRAAFYRNYRDKYQLVEQIFEEAMGELLGTMTDQPGTPVLERWTGFFEHIDHYHRLYGALAGSHERTVGCQRRRASRSHQQAHVKDQQAEVGWEFLAHARAQDTLGAAHLHHRRRTHRRGHPARSARDLHASASRS
ncbi:TetR/AcrR family transcriptional regulator [Nonomuraea insulae]|uniref:TetR/AcrR family transcriptional regulator n=1 Tax=Nonomuraea insulae TaxID=1616787 RepID=A0ABW1CRR4_9ACTN